MAKPTEVTDWATQGASGSGGADALRTATDVTRRTLGWQTTPNNLPGEQGEKPNLNEQNYWQYAVHKWIEWVGAQLPDGTELLEKELYTFDSTNFLDTADATSATELDFVGMTWDPANETFYTDTDTTWEDQQSLFGTWMDVIYALNKGASLKIVNSNSQTYILKPIVGVHVESATLHYDTSVPTAHVAGLRLLSTGNFDIYLNGSSVSDFSAWSGGSQAVTVTAILYEYPTVEIGYSLSSRSQIKRRTHRPLVGMKCQFPGNIGTNYVMPIDMVEDQWYKVVYRAANAGAARTEQDLEQPISFDILFTFTTPLRSGDTTTFHQDELLCHSVEDGTTINVVSQGNNGGLGPVPGSTPTSFISGRYSDIPLIYFEDL